MAKILPPEEWHRLSEECGLGVLLPLVEPHNVQIAAVEKGEEIVACVSVLQLSHFEGLWIRPDERGNAGVFRALIREAYAVPRERGERFILGGSETGDERMDGVCSRLGGRPINARFFAMPVGG